MNLKILKNYFFNLIIVFTNIIFPMLLFPYASRVLTPENFGKYSFGNSIASYFITFGTLGISAYGVREISNLKLKDSQELKKGFTELIILTLISSLVSFAIFLLMIYGCQELRVEKKLFLIFSLQVIFSFITLDYFFIAMEKHKRRTYRVLIIKSISLIFLFLFVKESKDYEIFALIIIVPELLAKLIDLYSVRDYLDIKQKLDLKKHIKSMIIIFIYLFSTTVYLNLDTTMLGILKTNKEVGYYSVAIKMTKIIIPLITSLGLVLTPEIIKNINNKDNNEFFKSIDSYLDFILFFTLPIIIILGFTSERLIFLFSGKEYILAVIPMQIMLPIILLISISGLCAAQVLIPLGKEKNILKISIIGLITNIALNILFIPNYSIVGAAVATVISELLVCILRISGVKKELKEYKILKKYRINYIYSSVFIFIVGIFFNKFTFKVNNFIQIFIVGSSLMILYLISLLILKDKYLYNLIKKIERK